MFEQMRIDMKRYIKSRFAFFSFLLLALLFLASLFSGLGKAETQQLTALGAIQETASQVQAKADKLSKEKKTDEADREKERLTYLEPLISAYSSTGNTQTRNELNLANCFKMIKGVCSTPRIVCCGVVSNTCKPRF